MTSEPVTEEDRQRSWSRFGALLAIAIVLGGTIIGLFMTIPT